MPPIYLEEGQDAAACISGSKKRKAEEPLPDEIRDEIKSAKGQQTTHLRGTVRDSIGKLMIALAGPGRATK